MAGCFCLPYDVGCAVLTHIKICRVGCPYTIKIRTDAVGTLNVPALLS